MDGEGRLETSSWTREGAGRKGLDPRGPTGAPSAPGGQETVAEVGLGEAWMR